MGMGELLEKGVIKYLDITISLWPSPHPLVSASCIEERPEESLARLPQTWIICITVYLHCCLLMGQGVGDLMLLLQWKLQRDSAVS